ncbi:PQQ-dependent sugar dehydrogenase [Pseudobdellovibrio exovorus]|uniref:Glucose/Sorbosone dehydrogenase domain-containing protein n=1 Tax=Pseudobdellovibrio exovorus JSS TaxID=1184267 RepID=M4VB73_9BACT|nr:PQQ-dependent sugar dehydrogenase [Pseudobdellovibrio exovorus]AGH96637.1 hypothetical protein A11Q_2421 [Pseudobdellovibrio exovorus JSS]
MRQQLQLIFPALAIFLAFVLVSNCGPANSQSTTPPQSLSADPPQLSKTNLMMGLSQPWDLAFVPNGDLLFTERCIGLSVRKTDGQTVRLFGPAGAILAAPDMFCEGQSGAHGIAIDPDFQSNRMIYLFMASNISNPRTNRVVRLTVNSDYSVVNNRVDIITDIPFKHQSNSHGGIGAHSGGRLRFGPDGYLYVTTGDNHNGPLPQDLQRLGGKVLRVDRNGQAAAGNNTPFGGDARIFTYGHRNVQGICFHPDTGQAYTAEHGPNHSDEVTLISAGGNAGWDPKPDAGVNCADNYCGYGSNNTAGTPTSMTDLNKFPNAMKPVLSMNDSQGMGPCGFLVGSQWKSWDRALVVGIMGGARLEVLQVANENLIEQMTAGQLPAARLRSTVQGPDGNLYIATDAGEIWVVTPAP